ncbi:uncharacterized protein F5Z01DRAFT_640069 [Emericellopsis atlantica]|uniref:Uncharacterized protein n=1 Tax=Emericellopsis atlantica TaxID=2614577 RepID=A0A9P7ZEV4_9HYPO|nr:uncharacterized protein F5Z01DRAFT_640069 [Emericellopsis atlantica]KAG9250661.1 hypothetical protein F5Z01DRAFT_640069 [Emericellopsis atlantica]
MENKYRGTLWYEIKLVASGPYFGTIPIFGPKSPAGVLSSLVPSTAGRAAARSWILPEDTMPNIPTLTSIGDGSAKYGGRTKAASPTKALPQEKGEQRESVMDISSLLSPKAWEDEDLIEADLKSYLLMQVRLMGSELRVARGHFRKAQIDIEDLFH